MTNYCNMSAVDMDIDYCNIKIRESKPKESKMYITQEEKRKLFKSSRLHRLKL